MVKLEVIKELAEQAGFCHDINNGIYLCAPMHMEKFAELIVRECADHIMTSSDRYRKEHFAHKILEHFGIET